jgi:hypothetical protein
MENDNLKPWSERNNPSPSSQPKHATISGAARDLLGQLVPGDRLGRTYAELIASRLIDRMCSGDARAARELREATEGKLAAQPDHPLEILIKYVSSDGNGRPAKPDQGQPHQDESR